MSHKKKKQVTTENPQKSCGEAITPILKGVTLTL